MLRAVASYLILKNSPVDDTPVEEMEKLQQPVISPSVNDCYYFNGIDMSGTALISRIVFKDREQPDVWFDLKIPGLGNLSIPEKKYTRVSGIACGPLQFSVVDPGRVWDISYSGQALLNGREKRIAFDARFSGSTPVVHANRNMDFWSMARYLSREKLRKACLERLRKQSLVSYEQGGDISGTAVIDKNRHPLKLKALRGRSCGDSRWTNMNRHLRLTGCMNDGSIFAINLFSYSFLPFLHTGYIVRENRIYPISSTDDFSGVPHANPRSRSFSLDFKSAGGKKAQLNCHVEDVFLHNASQDYRTYQGLVRFRLGNTEGTGFSEFGFNNRLYR